MASVQGYKQFIMKMHKIMQDICCLGKSGRLLGCDLPAGSKEMSNDYLCCETPLSSKPTVCQRRSRYVRKKTSVPYMENGALAQEICRTSILKQKTREKERNKKTPKRYAAHDANHKYKHY